VHERLIIATHYQQDRRRDTLRAKLSRLCTLRVPPPFERKSFLSRRVRIVSAVARENNTRERTTPGALEFAWSQRASASPLESPNHVGVGGEIKSNHRKEREKKREDSRSRWSCFSPLHSRVKTRDRRTRVLSPNDRTGVHNSLQMGIQSFMVHARARLRSIPFLFSRARPPSPRRSRGYLTLGGTLVSETDGDEGRGEES